MASVASEMETEEAVLFMLDNFYSVYSKNYQDGIQWSEQSLDYAINIGNVQYEGRANLALGTIWYLRGDYELSITYYQIALDIFESLDDQCWMGRTYNQLSVYDRKQKQYEKGLADLDESFRLCTNCGDKECLETSLNNRGVIYEMMGKYDLALEFYRKAQRIAMETNNDLGLSYIYNNLAECHRLLENYDSVIFYVELSTEIREEMEDYTGMVMNFTNLGETLTLAEDYQNAEKYLNEAVELSLKISYLDMASQAYGQLFKLHKQTGDLDKAVFCLDESLRLKDSILSVEKIKSLSEMEVKYQTEKVEKEFAEEQQLRAESELKVANRNNWIISITSGSILIVFAGLLLYQRKMKRAQEEKNKAVLDEKQRGLEAVFDATEEERQRIAKDLHDGVGQQMSGLKLALDNLSTDLQKAQFEDPERIGKLSGILNETAQDIRDISHQMMPKVLSEFGLIEALDQMLDKSLSITPISHEFEHFNIKGRFSSRIEIGLFRIAQELINNVIKHSEASQVSVQLFQNKEQLIMMVEDNGKGFQGDSTEGHGLLNIQSRLNTISGEVNYEASTEQGTLVTVRVDLSKQSD